MILLSNKHDPRYRRFNGDTLSSPIDRQVSIVVLIASVICANKWRNGTTDLPFLSEGALFRALRDDRRDGGRGRARSVPLVFNS